MDPRMAFRDELDAAHARIARLEDELRATRGQGEAGEDADFRARAQAAERELSELRQRAAETELAHRQALRRARGATIGRAYAKVVGKNPVAFYVGVASLLLVGMGAAYVRHAREHPLYYAEGTCQLAAPSDEGKRTAFYTGPGGPGSFTKRDSEAWPAGEVTVPCWFARDEGETFGTIVRPKNAEVPRSFDWVFAAGLVAVLFGVLSFALSRSPPARDD